VGILMSQCGEAALAHIAAYKLGAIAMPLFAQFGPDALQYRLGMSKASVCVVDVANLDKVRSSAAFC
jgi:acetyl-CoA synthetase